MAATRSDKTILIPALVLSLIALAVLVVDKLANPDIANRETFDLLQLAFSVVALACGVAVLVRGRRRRTKEEPVIDLRERLGDLVDIDDVATDEAMNLQR